MASHAGSAGSKHVWTPVKVDLMTNVIDDTNPPWWSVDSFSTVYAYTGSQVLSESFQIQKSALLPFASDGGEGGTREVLSSLCEAIPALGDVEIACPCCSGMREPDILTSIVQHLNDYHMVSREWIADWLETLPLDLSFPVPEETR